MHSFQNVFTIITSFLFSDERDYDCGRCEKIFKNRSVFAEHLRKYHMISIKDVTNMLFTLKPDEQKDEAEQQEIILH